MQFTSWVWSWHLKAEHFGGSSKVGFENELLAARLSCCDQGWEVCALLQTHLDPDLLCVLCICAGSWCINRIKLPLEKELPPHAASSAVCCVSTAHCLGESFPQQMAHGISLTIPAPKGSNKISTYIYVWVFIYTLPRPAPLAWARRDAKEHL